MPAEVFFDTSVLLYAVAESDSRTQIADSLLAAGGSISVQVLNEFVSVARRKLKMDWGEIERLLSLLRKLCQDPAPLELGTHEAALAISRRYGFQIYDSLIVASALEAGCTILYSEDMQHGQKIDSLTIQNPFSTH